MRARPAAAGPGFAVAARRPARAEVVGVCGWCARRGASPPRRRVASARALALLLGGVRPRRAAGIPRGAGRPGLSKGNRVNIPERERGDGRPASRRVARCGNASELGDVGLGPGKSSLFPSGVKRTGRPRSPRSSVGRDPLPRQCQAGSLTGAVHLSKSNAGVLRRAQRGQKPRVEQKGKSSLDFDFQYEYRPRKRGLSILLSSSFEQEVSEKLPQG